MRDLELHSALIVAVPEAAGAVDDWRERTSYAKPSSGVPPHITILSPFKPPADIDDVLVDELRAVFDAFERFAFELGAVRQFPGVLYLAPHPAEPFARMTEAVWRRFPDCPPYGGTFDSIVPHLTTAEGDDETLSAAEAHVSLSLPIAAEATEVLLIEEIEPDSARWETRTRLPLRAV